VRDGDPRALAGLCEVRGPAVLAYCEVVAGRGAAAIAAVARGAVPSPICAGRCATASAMMAKYCDWAACAGARDRERSCC
jgi:hypothetical protein